MQCVSDGTRDSVSGAPKAFRRTYGILLHTICWHNLQVRISLCAAKCVVVHCLSNCVGMPVGQPMYSHPGQEV